MQCIRKVFRVSEIAIELGVDRALAGCPFVVATTSMRSYLNEYLRDRFLGRWMPPGPGEKEPRVDVPESERYRPAGISVWQAAHRINNFLEFLEAENGHPHWMQAHDKTIEEYGDAMEKGEWSSDAKALASSTIANRQTEAIHFLNWAKQRGLTDFEAEVEEVTVTSVDAPVK